MSFITKRAARGARPTGASFLHALLIFGVAVVFWGGYSQGVFAVKNNSTNIPNVVLQSLRNRSQNVDKEYVNNYGGPNLTIKSPPCATKNNAVIYHFQSSWLSPEGKPATSSGVTVNYGTNSVELQYNRVAGYCHYVFTPVLPLSNSKIIDESDLRVTGTRLTDYKAVIVGKDGEHDVGLGISGLSTTEDLDIINYEHARSNSLRFVKNGDQPYAKKFTLSGLQALSPGNYTVKITLGARLVNRFGAGADAVYRCVSGAAITSATAWSSDSAVGKTPNCPVSTTSFTINLTIPKAYDGTCDISGVPPTLSPGQKFTPTFTVSNTGTKAWPVAQNDVKKYFKLRPVSGNPWGKNPVLISGTGVVGPNLPAKTTTSFTPGEITTPSGTIPDFSWRIVYDGTGVGEEGIPSRIAECSSPVNAKSNQPFLRVSGGDTVTGASFSNDQDEENPYFYQSEQAKNAEINTNGKNPTNGSSSSEYAVFASGFISRISSLPNQFSSNDFYEQNGTKDLTFANTEVPSGGTNYGKFYGSSDDPALPNVDISQLITIAKKNTNPGGGSNAVFKDYVTRSMTDNPTGKPSAYFDVNNQDGYSVSTGFTDIGTKPKIIVVKGDVTIGNNLVYGSANANMILVVLGNLYIKSNVTHMDGTYIAFPIDDSSGIVDTCSNVDDDKLTVDSANCGNNLTINGRLIASKVLWKRTYGTLGPIGSAADPKCVYQSGKYDECAAEFIHFSPAAYFNSPLDDSETHIDNKPSNVPSSTIILPPIY